MPRIALRDDFFGACTGATEQPAAFTKAVKGSNSAAGFAMLLALFQHSGRCARPATGPVGHGWRPRRRSFAGSAPFLPLSACL
jgi:hypothetical protein